MEKITRDQIMTFLDTTPASENETWSLLGQGITEFGLEYNPQKTTEKFIINRNATTSLESYQISGSASQKIYKGDPCFEFVNNLRRNASVGSKNETHILDVDKYDADEGGSYKATKYDCTISITRYLSDEAVIEYDIDYNGQPTLGTVTIADGAVKFTPEI